MNASASRHRWTRIGAVATAALTLVATVGLAALPAQAADSPSADPATVTADVLPTWQINGVVWSEAVAGNTVYVTGSFTKARPPGVAAGGAGEIDAPNIFAFDITTGNPVPNFAHALDAQGLVVRTAPDGKSVYVGGDFTSVDWQARAHVAAFDVATGALLPWAPRTDGQVRGFAFVGDTVYAGGNFRSSNGQPRTQLAAWNATTGDLTAWAPTATGDGFVWDMLPSPDGTRIIVAGSFTQLNGTDAYGMGALDAATGATLGWAATDRIHTGGLNGAISSLSTDGTQVYGTGYAFGSGAQFEGTFAADPYTGSIDWVNDCLGDTYGTFPSGGVLYSVSHHHDCSVINGFPDTNPRTRWMKALAERTQPIGITTKKDAYGWDFRGIPYSGLLDWFPELAFGSYTSADQAAWSVTGNADYVVLGGEFPKVNGIAQQGLVRFGTRAVSPHKMGPIYGSGMTPAPYSNEAGTVRVPFSSVWDRDGARITYDVYRSPGVRIATLTRSDSTFWSLPSLSVVDTGQTPGSQVRYQVRATDSDGNVQWSAWSPYVTVSSTPVSAYTTAVRASGPSHYWRLDEGTGTLYDDGGDAPGTATGLTQGAAGALLNDADAAVSSPGGSTAKMTTRDAMPADAQVSVEAWVKTTSSRGGRIVGFGDSASGTSTSGGTDRVLYLDNSGRANFAVRTDAYHTVYSRAGINDGQWHHLVGTVGSAGMQLFVDGRRVDRDQSVTSLDASGTGYWRIGADQTAGFANRPSNSGLAGTVDEVAVYPSALSKDAVQAHYLASGRSAAWSPAPTDAYGAAVSADQPDLYWRLDEASGSKAGDFASGGTTGNISGSVTRSQPGAVAGDDAMTFNGGNGLVVAQEAWESPSTYSAELWFNSTSTRGGTLIGFGNTTSGLSSSYDRHVVMQSDGRLQFGVYDGTEHTIVSPSSYNDGRWHQVVAVQGPAGMSLWVDAQRVAADTVTGAQAYRGYWRIGGDRTWGSTASSYIAATLDEAAVYPAALTETQIRAHYAAGGGSPAARPPVAAFTSGARYLAASFDASGSSDPDGSITSYTWDFGDGSSGSGVTAGHTYAQAGSYTVTLTVADAATGLSGTSSQTVVVAADEAPTAAFTATADRLTVAVDASSSTDPDGDVTAYSWDFGDGATATGKTATHTYAAPGVHTVSLTVTDDAGATDTATEDVTLAGNQAPTAAFTAATADLAVHVDGSGSSDPDGTIAAYSWDFGDGAAGTGATADHTYAAAGSYPVTLTVTDDSGATATATHTVTVAAPVVFAQDGFGRTVSGGWGTADTGGAWSVLPNTTTARGKFAVAGGTGTVAMSPGNNYTAALTGATASTDTEERFTASFDHAATGGGSYFSGLVRQIDASNDYRGKLRVSSTGAVAVWLTRTVGGTETVLASTTAAGLSLPGPGALSVRIQATGSGTTTLRAKVWTAGTPEPSAWTISTTDGTAALQAAGYVGVNSYLSASATSPVTYGYDDFWAGPAR